MTPLQREALQMCLEYIETDAHERRHVRWKINEALAQPQQEPVAWIPIITWRWNNNAETWEGLTNTPPPARKPLTDEEIDAIGAKIFNADFLDVEEIHANRDIARAIEAAHGITGEQK